MNPAAIKDLIASIPNWGWSVPVALIVILIIVGVIVRLTKQARWRSEYERLRDRSNQLRVQGRIGDALLAASKAAKYKKKLSK